MKTIMRNVATALSLAMALAACATTTSAQRLADLQAFAGEPQKQIVYFAPSGWDPVDDQYLVINMRPSESYLVKLSGPCLKYDNGSPSMFITNTAGYVQNNFDYVSFGTGMRCRIIELRPVDLVAMRAANKS